MAPTAALDEQSLGRPITRRLRQLLLVNVLDLTFANANMEAKCQLKIPSEEIALVSFGFEVSVWNDSSLCSY